MKDGNDVDDDNVDDDGDDYDDDDWVDNIFYLRRSCVIRLYGDVYGNNVTCRDAYLSSGARKSQIGLETRLPAGRLVNYYTVKNLPLNLRKISGNKGTRKFPLKQQLP